MMPKGVEHNDNLSIALSAAVPLHIMRLQTNGGPTDAQLAELPAISQLIAEHGDTLLFGSKKKGEAADIFNQVAHAIACLSYTPSGVTIFGQHYETVR